MLSILESLFYEMDDTDIASAMTTPNSSLDLNVNGVRVTGSVTAPDSTEKVGGIFHKTVGPDGQNNYALFNMQRAGNMNVTAGDGTQLANATYTRDNFGNVSGTITNNNGTVNVQQDASSQSGLVDRAKFGINRAVNYTAHNPGTVAAGAAGAAALGYGAYRGIKSLNQRPNQQLNQQRRY